ncbi:MAG: hypothetical protein ACXWJ0_01365 [Xanthobacteraceae bacterium]
MPNLPRKPSVLIPRLAVIVCLCAIGLALSACDKCGNSIFGSNAGPFACKEKLPQ